MEADIVDRLRSAAKLPAPPVQYLTEAANVIEKLRAWVKRLEDEKSNSEAR